MFGGLGAPELIVVFAIVLLLFGGKKLPEVAKSMGSAMRAFRDEANSLKREIDLEAESETSGSSSQGTQASTAGAGESDEDSETTRQTSEASTTETTTETAAETEDDKSQSS